VGTFNEHHWGISASAITLTRFAAFCDRAGVEEWADIDRDLLERYLADLGAELAGRQRHGDQIGQLGAFLQTIRVHRWEPSLPATAMLFSEDYPQRAERPPRALPEQVMAQLEHTDNLDRWNNDAHRLVTVILIRCGLRVNDALRLPRECVVLDADHAPYLRYFNHKMKREALVPIDEELHALITERARTLTTTPAHPTSSLSSVPAPASRRASSSSDPTSQEVISKSRDTPIHRS